MTPSISVLTPVYNGEKYLAECIESVLAQTRSDWEYIIVDNCSTDRSAAIAERYANADSRVRLVRCTEFVSVHRNFCRAIDLMDANSHYCKFVCADDWIYPECLARMVDVMERHPSVGVVSSYRLTGNYLENDGLLPYTEELMPGREALRRAFLNGTEVTGSQTTLLFRAEVVQGTKPFFDEKVWHSDTDAAMRSLMHTDLGFVHQVLTYTRLHPNTLTSSVTDRIHTYQPFAASALIRYGSKVLTGQAYAKLLRASLKRYWWFLFKQALKPSRRRDKTFQAFHNAQLLRLLSEIRSDERETRAILKCARALLADREVTIAL